MGVSINGRVFLCGLYIRDSVMLGHALCALHFWKLPYTRFTWPDAKRSSSFLQNCYPTAPSMYAMQTSGPQVCEPKGSKCVDISTKIEGGDH